MDLALQQNYVPQEAHLYFPKKHSVKYTEAQRAVFDGNTEFNEDELEQIAKLNTYAEKQKYTFKPLWTDGMKLRFLYANNFKMSKALISIQEHTIWRETKLPVEIDDPLRKFLNSGLLYVHGRDSQFRPIVIMNVSLIDPKKTDVELVIRAMTFWLEYVIQEWMLPGQIENWVFMANMKGVGVATLAAQSMRKLFMYLSDNWKCRLQTLYLLNVVSSMYIPWQVVKPFLDDVTVQKMQFYKTQIPATLLTTANKEQIEEKYGGTAPNCTQFWPPIIPSNNYFVSPENSKALISREEYTALYKQGSLTNMRLEKSLLIERGHHRNLTAGIITDQPSQSAQIPIDRTLTSLFNFGAEPQTARNVEHDRYSFEPSTARNIPDYINNQFIDDFRAQAAAANKAQNSKQELDDFEEGDYVNYMDEAPKLDKGRNHVKHFEASFIEGVRQRWMSQSVKY